MHEYVQLKVESDEVISGMYVCKLDRPWVETPFPFQGFYVTRDREIELIRKYCNFVFIDIERGVVPDGMSAARKKAQSPVVELNEGTQENKLETKQQAASAVVKAVADIPKVKPLPIKKNQYGEPRQFQKQIRKAEDVYNELRKNVASVYNEIRLGKRLSMEKMRQHADQMVQQVVSNPDTLIWLARLQTVDTHSYDHSIRMSVWSLFLGRHIGLSEAKLSDLALGALFADIGKTKLSKTILSAAESELSDADLARKRAHVEYGIQIMVQDPAFPEASLDIIASHHERFDGRGYPSGLRGDEIPLLARIVGLVDEYLCMVSPRRSQDTLSPSQAVDELYKMRNNLFQSQLVDEFIQAVGIYPSGTAVEMSTGEKGVVISHDFRNRLRPRVARIISANGEKYEKGDVVDLSSDAFDEDGNLIRITKALPIDGLDFDVSQVHMEHVRKQASSNSVLSRFLGA